MEIQALKIIRTFAEELLTTTLRSRYDICTCPRCKEKMLTLVMDELHALGLGLAGKSPEAIREGCGRDLTRAILHAMDHVGERPPHALTEDRKKAFKSLVEKISSERGLDLRNYHSDLLKRRIALRLQLTNTHSYTNYIAHLSKNPSEYDKLFETLCINVSEFFRDPPVWVTMQYLFESLIRSKVQNATPRLTVWSCGCACGEEPYSVAIVILEALAALKQKMAVAIKATDIDKACLNAAHQAAYAKESVKNLDSKLLERYFELADGKYAVREEVKKLVEFEYLDLTSQDYITGVDVIVCRNVFIYFNRDLQRTILLQFYRCLNPGGYVVLGKSETAYAEKKNLFEIIDVNARIFKKIPPA